MTRCRDCSRVLAPTEEHTSDVFGVRWCLPCYRRRTERLEARERNDRSDIMDRFDSPDEEIRRGAR